LDDHCERAMVTFLDHRQFWKGATHFYYADNLPYWRKRKAVESLSKGTGMGGYDTNHDTNLAALNARLI
jgi:hypothetical protein